MYVVRGKVMYLHVSVILLRGGGGVFSFRVLGGSRSGRGQVVRGLGDGSGGQMIHGRGGRVKWSGRPLLRDRSGVK